MEPVPTHLPESIMDDKGQLFPPAALASSHFCPLVCQGRCFLQGMSDIVESNEPAPQTSCSTFQEQVFHSYEVHQLKLDASTTQTAAEAFRGTFNYVQNNGPVLQNLYPDLRSPFQGSMWSLPFRDFPPAVLPTPQNFPALSPCGTRVWDGVPPFQLVPRAPGDPSCGRNMGFLPQLPLFGFSSGTYMLVKVPEFCQGAFIPAHQQFLQHEGCPSRCLPTGRFCQTGRPPLFHRTRDSVVLNATPSLEDRWPTKAEEEHHHHHHILTPDQTKVQGSHFSSQPLVGLQDHLQTLWTREDNKDVPNSICPKSREKACAEQNVKHEQKSPATGSSSSTENLEDLSSDSDSNTGSILDKNDQNCLRPSDLEIWDQFTLEDVEALIQDELDPLCNQKDAITEETRPPPTEIERIIQYLLQHAPISAFEPHPVKEEPSTCRSPSSRLRQSPLKETPEDECGCFPLDDRFDMSHRNSKRVRGDDGNRRRKRNPVNPSLRGTARDKAMVTDARPKSCMVIRNSQGGKGRTDEPDGYGYALRAEQRKPAEIFTPQRSSSSSGRQRKPACARRQLFKTEQIEYKETRPDRAKTPTERTVGKEHKKYLGRSQESKAPRGKPLDFCRRKGIMSNLLSGMQEEPREEVSKAARRKTQRKNAEDSVQPAQRRTKGGKSSPKRKARANVHEDPHAFQLPQSRQKKQRTGENMQETAQPVEMFRAEGSRSQFPPARSTEPKQDQTVDTCSHKALKTKTCPSRRTREPPSLKSAERSPDSSLFLHPAFSGVPKQQCRVSLGANTADLKPKASQMERNGERMEPGPITDQTEDEEAEQLRSQNTAKKRRRRSNSPKKRKGGPNETAERLWSSPAKKPRESRQRGFKLRLKMEKGSFQRTWLTE